MKLIAKTLLVTKAGDVRPGEEIDIKDKAEAERLIAIGAVEKPRAVGKAAAPASVAAGSEGAAAPASVAVGSEGAAVVAGAEEGTVAGATVDASAGEGGA